MVEDTRDSADMLRVLLELYGYEVAVAYTGPEGVKAAGEWGPDVVLCDIGLPGLDGYGVARELRSLRTTRGALLIALTAYGTEEDVQRAGDAGFDYHVTKPADPDALVELLRPAG